MKKRRYWIFQADPTKRKIDLQDFDEDEDTWTVRQHEDDIQKGDIVLLWETGPDAAFHGVVEICGAVRARKSGEPWYSRPDEKRVPIKLIHRFSEPVSKSELDERAKRYKVLERKDLLGDPWQGTNKAINRRQWAALAKWLGIGDDGKSIISIAGLYEFLQQKMSMTEVYQPVIVKELLRHGGERTKDELSAALIKYDRSYLEYYRKVLMRWPKSTLSKHEVIRYERESGRFILNCKKVSKKEIQGLVDLCDSKIEEWLQAKEDAGQAPQAKASVRYRILAEANGKCQLCGIPSSLRPIDVDHIVPQSSSKKGKVTVNGKLVGVHSEDNLQALCAKCNRAKRASDDTSFKRTQKLVRDRIPEIIKGEGRDPIVKKLKGNKFTQALNEKLVEEHGEYIASNKVDELVDMLEVIFSLAKAKGKNQAELLRLMKEKRAGRGGFAKKLFYEGDK